MLLSPFLSLSFLTFSFAFPFTTTHFLSFYGPQLTFPNNRRESVCTGVCASADKMRSLLSSLFLLLLAALVHAASSDGARLLVVTDDAAGDREVYSKFLGDVEGMSFLQHSSFVLVRQHSMYGIG